MAPVHVSALTKQFGAFNAVNAIDFAIRDGEFVFFLGPSGCGKTTTLRMIAGLLMPSGGRIEIGRRDVTYLRPRHRNVGMVFQQNVLYSHLSVFDNLAYPLRVRGFDRATLKKKVEEVARTLQIDDVMNRMPDQLSGGQSQRVAIGRMLVREADVFLMDEPISHLDAKLRAHMRAELRHLQKKLGVTTLFVSHDQLEAMSMADRIMVMSDGVIQQFAPPQEIFDSPANLFVASFVGEPHMNTIETTLDAGPDGPVLVAAGFRFEAPSGWLEDGLAAQRGSPFVLGVRPEQVRVAARPERNHFETTLYAVEPLGAEDLMTLDCGGAFVQARIPTDEAAALPNRPGAKLYVTFSPDHLYLFDKATGSTVAQARFTRS